MTPIFYGKKLKIRDDTCFGQVHADYKWLNLNSNPGLTPNPCLLNITLCTSQESHPDSHILSKYSRQGGHFKTQAPPGELRHLSKFLAQLIYNPL